MASLITTQDLYHSLQEKIGLKWIAGQQGADIKLRDDSSSAEGQEWVGKLNSIHPARIQLIGPSELDYLSGLEHAFYKELLDGLFSSRPAAIILADKIRVDSEFINHSETTHTPLLSASLPASSLLTHLQSYIACALAERKTEHGVFMEVLGIGVLIIGGAGIGKSELALELIYRGHRLIADDAPEFFQSSDNTIIGHCPPVLQDFLEVRGLGVIDIRAMFGDSAIKREMQLQLIIRLKQLNENDLKNIDHIRGSYTKTTVLNLSIPEVTIPVAPGREMAILLETAVRQHGLLLKGEDPVEKFLKRQQRAMRNQ